ncbi:DNA-binding response regulator [Streptomyces sp. LP05-1]|uniref:DNA-binding response regulator n=1 Tax=Streptomyces pyxinae TaxID=2970734 RepID=A0ABT2CMH3_9ACTN|nr:DNA-binding response regulator [Streptomyces sp. LP05-1]MCS0638617.1 DNA-binding response regulator [Streptomyces sp. LP05-1]
MPPQSREAARAAQAHGRRPPGQAVWGTRQVCAALAALTESAREELLTFDDPVGRAGQSVPEPFAELAGACVRAAVERVGTVRQIVPRHALPRLAAIDSGLVRLLPGRARLADSIPFKMIVVDRSVAAVPLDLELLCNGILLIRDPAVVQLLIRAHRIWWDAAEDIGAPVTDRSGLPKHLRPVLRALAAGLTDEAAAARLSISQRTYSRRVGAVLAALGTTSRFRAGVEAVRRGWI